MCCDQQSEKPLVPCRVVSKVDGKIRRPLVNVALTSPLTFKEEAMPGERRESINCRRRNYLLALPKDYTQDGS
jgi:hypothetical protein